MKQNTQVYRKSFANNFTSNYGVRKHILIYSLLLIPLASYIALTLYPNILGVYYSFFQWDGLGIKEYVGLRNYANLFSDPFLGRYLLNNLVLMIMGATSITLISVVLSYLLTNKTYKENGFYKVLYYIPNVLSSVVIALLWSFVYDGNWGILNSIIKLLGIDIGNYFWLGDPKTALLAILLPTIWGSVGFYVVIYMNAMLSIPKSMYEAATLDGATTMTMLFKITLPLISGVLKVGVLFVTLGMLRSFDTILVLTNGGPGQATGVIGLYMYQMAFGDVQAGGGGIHSYSYASTVGVFMFVILVGAKLIIDRVFKGEEVEY